MSSITRRHQGADHRAAVEAQVLAATERLLAGGANFTELGVKQIADEAGIARSTFYVHFRDKTDLLLRLAADTKRQAFEVGEDWRPAAGGLPALIEGFEAVIAVYRDRAAVVAAVHETAGYDPVVRDFWDSEIERFAERMRTILVEEQRAGRVAAGLDPDTAARVMAWSGERVIARHVAVRDPADDAALARELAMQRWYGVYARTAEGPSRRDSSEQ
jgi:AcrR family transcriptional regulator